ncbi:MAG: AAA family ATPase [Deltaproteobacteria bacterium]|nr:MAG: AAA family ATPase [Deltaproteobacteria bacterium]
MHRALKNLFYEVREPRLTWDDVGGLHGPKEKLREMVSFVAKNLDRLEDMGIDPPAGVMMWGPLGTGITMLAEAAAADAGLPFVYVSGQEVLGKGGDLEEAFRVALYEAPSLLFVSDVEWLCPRPGCDYSWSNGNERGKPPTFADTSLKEKFIALIDEVCRERRVRLLGSCYRIDTVDQAVIKEKTRFNRKIFVPPPGAEDRLEILRIYASRTRLGSDVDLEAIARETVGYVGWDVENLVRKAVFLAVERGSPVVEMRDFRRAMEKVEPWLTPDMEAKYHEIYRADCPHHYHF